MIGAMILTQRKTSNRGSGSDSATQISGVDSPTTAPHKILVVRVPRHPRFPILSSSGPHPYRSLYFQDRDNTYLYYKFFFNKTYKYICHDAILWRHPCNNQLLFYICIWFTKILIFFFLHAQTTVQIIIF